MGLTGPLRRRGTSYKARTPYTAEPESMGPVSYSWSSSAKHLARASDDCVCYLHTYLGTYLPRYLGYCTYSRYRYVPRPGVPVSICVWVGARLPGFPNCRAAGWQQRERERERARLVSTASTVASWFIAWVVWVFWDWLRSIVFLAVAAARSQPARSPSVTPSRFPGSFSLFHALSASLCPNRPSAFHHHVQSSLCVPSRTARSIFPAASTRDASSRPYASFSWRAKQSPILSRLGACNRVATELPDYRLSGCWSHPRDISIIPVLIVRHARHAHCCCRVAWLPSLVVVTTTLSDRPSFGQVSSPLSDLCWPPRHKWVRPLRWLSPRPRVGGASGRVQAAITSWASVTIPPNQAVVATTSQDPSHALDALDALDWPSIPTRRHRRRSVSTRGAQTEARDAPVNLHIPRTTPRTPRHGDDEADPSRTLRADHLRPDGRPSQPHRPLDRPRRPALLPLFLLPLRPAHPIEEHAQCRRLPHTPGRAASQVHCGRSRQGCRRPGGREAPPADTLDRRIAWLRPGVQESKCRQ